MEKERPLTDRSGVLQELGNGPVWTFVELPEIPLPKTPFGMLRVKGRIDDYEFSGKHLMPTGNGHVGLPVSAAVRKKIKKQAPDTVHVTLYEDKTPPTVPEELLLCLGEEEGALEKFEAYPPGQQRAFVRWIKAAKTEQTQADRIARTIDKVLKGEKFY